MPSDISEITSHMYRDNNNYVSSSTKFLKFLVHSGETPLPDITWRVPGEGTEGLKVLEVSWASALVSMGCPTTAGGSKKEQGI